MFLRIFKTGLVLLIVILLAAAIWLAHGLYTPVPLPSGDVLFEVKRGAPTRTVARSLKEEGLIKSSLTFLAAHRLFYAPRSIKAGEYAFSPPARAKDILSSLVEGRVYLHAVTIPEGLTGMEIAPIFGSLLSDGEEGFLASFRDPSPVADLDPEAADLEGYLFPETYHFARGIHSGKAIRSLVEEFRSVFSEAWQERTRELGMNARHILTLASLIEKETSIPAEKPLVSAVFHNRLRIGMKLDCDPTIIYALKQRGVFTGNLTKKDMSLDSPYNTYRHPGLPPGPICNPGREAIEAALFPAREDFLYFVSRNDGSHHFSRSFAEHQAAVRRFQKKGGGA